MAQDVTRDVSAPINGGEAVSIGSGNHVASTYSRAIWVGTGGDVVVVTRNGTTLTLPNVQDGTMLAVRVRSIVKVGTSASDMVLLW